MRETVTVSKLVHGGQALGTLSDGRKIFVWGALPEETAVVRVTRSKKQYAEGIAESIVTPSPERVEPKEPYYLATSPWQIMTLKTENQAKADIVSELLTHEGIGLPASATPLQVQSAGPDWGYRNKMEFAFWADDDGLHLAHYGRGSHQKIPVQASVLALPAVNRAAEAVRAMIAKAGAQGRQLKTVVVRADQSGQAVAALFVKDKDFMDAFKPGAIGLPDGLKGLQVNYSDPRSPASVITATLQTFGDVTLTDTILNTNLAYNVNSFFQVNIPAFTEVMGRMRTALEAVNTVVDMYSGVGGIGLGLAAPGAKLTLIELDPGNVAMAKRNAKGSKAKVVQASTENALDHITGEGAVIFDPPRSGLHAKVVDRLLDVKPPLIVYLSCNPATQARDLALLKDAYRVDDFAAYNFFPHTPHIETLAVLRPYA